MFAVKSRPSCNGLVWRQEENADFWGQSHGRSNGVQRLWFQTSFAAAAFETFEDHLNLRPQDQDARNFFSHAYTRHQTIKVAYQLS